MDTVSPLSLKSILQAVRHRWRLALTITLAMFVAGTVGTLLLKKKYTSTAIVLIAPAGADMLGPQNASQGAATDPFFVHSETDIASGDGVSRGVIQQLELWTNPDFQPFFHFREWLGLPPAKDDSGLSQR